VEAEFAAFLGSHADLKLADGRQRIVGMGMIRFADPDVNWAGRGGKAQARIVGL